MYAINVQKLNINVGDGQRLTAEGGVSPGTNGDSTILTLIHIGLYGLTKGRLESIQFTQVKHAVLEEALERSQYIEL